MFEKETEVIPFMVFCLLHYFHLQHSTLLKFHL